MRPVSLVALFVACPLFAQLSEKIEVSVVNVDVTVTDHAEPIRGLTRDDLDVFEDGVPQQLTNFYEVAAEVRGAPPSDDERFRRKVLLIIDSRRVSAYEIHDTLDQIRRNRLPFAEASLPLRQAIFEGQLTVDALIDAMRAFRSANGEKIVLLITRELLPFGTFMISGTSVPVSLNFGQRREVEDGVIVTMKVAVPSGTTFGPVELFVSLFDPTGRNVFSIRRAFSETTEFFVPHGKPYRVVVAVRDAVSEAVGVTQQVIQF